LQLTAERVKQNYFIRIAARYRAEEGHILNSSSETNSMLMPASDRLIGAHMPTSGGLFKSLTAGKEIGCTAVQLFTCSPRQWFHSALKQPDIDAFLEAKAETGIGFTAAHDSYLINLAAPSEEVLAKSRRAFRNELDRANQLEIAWLVTHMGAHLNEGEDEALDRLAESLKIILEETDDEGYNVGIALETTAGQGTGLGWRFEQLGRILNAAGPHARLGVCLDTCHIFVAGYDLRTEEAYEETWDQFETHIGRSTLKMIHANDAKKGLGSRVDRHEHIGQGEIGETGFQLLMQDSRLQHVPVIVETPESDDMHQVNVATLRGYAAGGV
jgi:deoxyribonuclease IV